MKIYLWLMFYWTFFSTKTVKSSAVVSPYYPLNGEDLIEGDIKEIEFWEKYYHRPKRSGDVSGSADIVNQFKSALVSGLKQKLGQLAQGSAGAVVGASAGFSKGSSSGHGEAKGPHTSYDHPHVTYEKPSYNLWDLKKSVLNTLLQAVKAIQGGVLAIKGQIIKGSGYVVSGGGKLLAAGGDKVTDIGKSIIQKAVLVPPKTHSSYHHSGYGTSGSYSAPSGAAEVYDAPPSSASGGSYGPESHYEGHYDLTDAKLHHGSEGLIVLRRIAPNKDKYRSSQSKSEELSSHSATSYSSSGSGGGVGNLVGKILGLASSSGGHQQQPAAPAAYDGKGDQFTPEDSHSSLNPPAPPHFEAEPGPPAPITHSAAPSTGEQNTHSLDLTFSKTNINSLSNSVPFGVDFSQQQDGYDDFQENLAAQGTNNYEQKVKLTRGELSEGATVASSKIQLPKDAPQSLGALKDALEKEQVNTGYKPSSLSLLYSPALIDIQKSPSKTQNSDPALSSLTNFLPEETPRIPSSFKTSRDGYSSLKSSYPSSKSHSGSSRGSSRYKSTSTRISSSKKRKRAPTEVRYSRPSSKGEYHVAKSHAYELTADGLKRLT